MILYMPYTYGIYSTFIEQLTQTLCTIPWHGIYHSTSANNTYRIIRLINQGRAVVGMCEQLHQGRSYRSGQSGKCLTTFQKLSHYQKV